MPGAAEHAAADDLRRRQRLVHRRGHSASRRTTTRGHKNSYPLMRLVARNGAGSRARHDRHRPAGVRRDGLHERATPRASGPGGAARGGLGQRPDPQRDMRLNILRLHDERQAGDRAFTQRARGRRLQPRRPVRDGDDRRRRRSCAPAAIVSEALSGSGSPGVEPLTQAVHGRHAGVIDPATGLTLDSTDEPLRLLPLPSRLGDALPARRDGRGGRRRRHARDAVPELPRLDERRRVRRRAPAGSTSRAARTVTPAPRPTTTARSATRRSSTRPGSRASPSIRRSPPTPNTPAAGLVAVSLLDRPRRPASARPATARRTPSFPASHATTTSRASQHQGHVGMLVECASCHGRSADDRQRRAARHAPGRQRWVSRHRDRRRENGGTRAMPGLSRHGLSRHRAVARHRPIAC